MEYLLILGFMAALYILVESYLRIRFAIIARQRRGQPPDTIAEGSWESEIVLRLRQSYCHGQESFPVRLDDELRMYGIDYEAMEDLAEEILLDGENARRLRKTGRGIGHVKTVGELATALTQIMSQQSQSGEIEL